MTENLESEDLGLSLEILPSCGSLGWSLGLSLSVLICSVGIRMPPPPCEVVKSIHNMIYVKVFFGFIF